MLRRSSHRSYLVAVWLVGIGCIMPPFAFGQVQHPEAEKQEKSQDPPIPPAQIPGENKPETKTPEPAPQPRSALNPDISVIGNGLGRFFGVEGNADRNRPLLGELEIALQQAIYPGIRFDVFLAGHAAESLSMDLEEAYATFTRFGGLPFGGFLGQKRLNFGKVNPSHPHAWLYADVPAALGSFLGPEGLVGNGLSANYTLPGLGDLFVNLELGAFKAVTHEEEHGEVAAAARSYRMLRKGRQGEPAHGEHGLGIAGSFPMARLWISKPLGHGGEVDFGTSHGYGKGENGDNILIQALDFTYRRFPGSYGRWILQSEWFKHRRTDTFGGTGKHSRDGYYLHLGFRPDRYYEYGIRYDNCRFAWPLEGSESGISFIWTNRMSESTLFRVQIKHGDRVGDSVLPAKQGYTEAWLQFVWGGGPHAPHPVQ